MLTSHDSRDEINEGAYVVIELIYAKELSPRDSNNVRSPFVIFKTQNHQVKSKTINKNLYPVWNQTLKLPISKETIKNKGKIESNFSKKKKKFLKI